MANMCMTFKIIACINERFALGKDNKLLYSIKEDMQNFKRQTTNNIIIMGKTTLESFKDGKPLPNRTNIVLTSDKSFTCDGAIIAHSIDEAAGIAIKGMFTNNAIKDVFVIGGASVYEQFINSPYVNEIRLTVVRGEESGDKYFPMLGDEWKLNFKTGIITDGNIEYWYEMYKRS